MTITVNAYTPDFVAEVYDVDLSNPSAEDMNAINGDSHPSNGPSRWSTAAWFQPNFGSIQDNNAANSNDMKPALASKAKVRPAADLLLTHSADASIPAPSEKTSVTSSTTTIRQYSAAVTPPSRRAMAITGKTARTR